MHKYQINNREVTKPEWTEAYKKHQGATVVLRIPTLPCTFQPPEVTNAITPEALAKFKRLPS